MKILGMLAAVTLYIGLSVQAGATPITYNESVDGQLSPSSPLVMGAGTNVVTGTGCWFAFPFRCNTFNNFTFEIPENMQLVGYRYYMEGLNPFYWHFLPKWKNRIALINYSDGETKYSNKGNWLHHGGQTLTVNLDTPMGSGDYRQFLFGSRTGVFGKWDYRIELDVVSTLTNIPLPATALFFGLGLGLAGLTRRRTVQAKV